MKPACVLWNLTPSSMLRVSEFEASVGWTVESQAVHVLGCALHSGLEGERRGVVGLAIGQSAHTGEIAFAGAEHARPQSEFIATLRDPMLRAVVICPSNPFISIDPILAVPGVRAALRDCRAPVIAVSPIIGGKAVKGPTAKMMAELGLPVDAATVATHYRDFLDLYIADEEDAAAVAGLDIPVVLTRTLMQSLADREALARAVLAAADQLRK